MAIRFHNTLTHRVESFEPIDSDNVYMYNCGPTVYDYGHIGNFRSFLFADVLRRVLELVGYNVHQVMNITNVGHMTQDQMADGGGEDKMLVGAKRIKEAKKQGRAEIENPDDPYQIADYFTKAFIDDAKTLGLKIGYETDGHRPLATDYIGQMQQIIQKLIDVGHAYISCDGTVYFDVQSFPPYGRLSGNTLDKLRDGGGGRVLDEHQAQKRHPADFLLWKPDASHIMKWKSPWGTGYPGWHIECSAMATSVLGRDVIDIHTGGEDNIFPHHECEIAQTCGATGHETFARFWMHSRHLLVNGEKMSKSKGNMHTVRDILGGKVTGRKVDPAVLRYELIKSHYRSNANFSRQGLEDSARAVQRLREAEIEAFHAYLASDPNSRDNHEELAAASTTLKEFVAAISNDLNISAALGIVFGWLKSNTIYGPEPLFLLQQFNQILQVMKGSFHEGSAPHLPAEVSPNDLGFHIDTSGNEIKHICSQIDDARLARDFKEADRLRQQLLDDGYEVKSTTCGTVASKKLA